MLDLKVGAAVTRTPQERIELARWVGRLTNDPAFGAVVVEVADTFVREWDRAPTLEARERAHFKLQGLKELVSHLQRMVEDGVLAERRQDQTSSPA